MKQRSLPFRQTGWLYLLLVLWGAGLWATHQGLFNQLNQMNREGLYHTLPVQQIQPKVLRVNSALGASNTDNIVELLNRYPATPIVILGEPSLSLLENLQITAQQHTQLNSVMIGSRQFSSARQITQSGFSGLISEFRTIQPKALSWKTSDKLIFAPLLTDSQGGFPLLWQQQDKAYLTLMGEALRQATLQFSSRIAVGIEIDWLSGNVVWPLGIQGQIYSGGELPTTISIEALLAQQQAPVKKPQLIILDDHTYPLADPLARTLERLLQQQYLHQGMWVVLLAFSLLLIGLLSIWFMWSLRVIYQGAILLGYAAILLVCQYIAFSQLQWLAILPTLVVVFLSWLILLGYQRENQILNQLSNTHNRLLGEVLPVYYHSQKIEKIHSFLESTSADTKLVSKVFDIAIEAEAKHNTALAKKLYRWIQGSGIKHLDSAKRLMQIQTESAKESLDQTLVIEAGATSVGNASNMGFGSVLAIESFGRYKVEGVLGKGAMGIVFQGVDPKINRHVAIKTLQLNQDSSEEALAETKARFFREAETAGNLSHANIVTIYDVGEEGDLGYIAMDLLTGAPLSEFTRPMHKLPAPLVYQLMIQITDALDYAHKQNVVHRDIKPGNIIYDDEIQRVTLTDFGIACVTDQSKTRTGTIMGSPYYMSPEQVLGQRVDGRSDIFSLGVTLYQLLSGYLPFEGESIASVAYHITTSKHAPVKQKDSRLPTSASRITNKAMQKDIDKRYQTAHEFKQALISALKRDFKKDPLV